MTKKSRATSKTFILSWLIIPLVVLWITTNYIIGLGRTTAWDASASQELVREVETASAPAEQLTWNHEGLITIEFDDAWSTQFDPAYSLMESYGYKGALAVPTHAVGTTGYMGWAQIKMMQHKGWEMDSHSQNHDCDLNHLTMNYEDKELGGAKKDLSSHGIYADNYVAPCGTINPAVVANAKKYYSSLRTSTGGVNQLPVIDPYNLKVRTIFRDSTIEDVTAWIEEAKQTNTWLILVVHQVDDGSAQFGMNEGMLRNTLDAVKASQLPVVLPNQVLQMKVASS